jgi:hypothetical protein
MLVMGTVCAQPDSTPESHQPIVEELKTLLGVKPDLAKALDEAIGNAGIVGVLSLDVIKKSDGSLHPVDGDTYQFAQERGLVVIDSPVVGLVAILPIGMAQVSSVNLTAEKGATLTKGEEFGYFLFGGSDIVMLFQNPTLKLDAQVGTHYLQGQKMGRVQ